MANEEVTVDLGLGSVFFFFFFWGGGGGYPVSPIVINSPVCIGLTYSDNI